MDVSTQSMEGGHMNPLFRGNGRVTSAPSVKTPDPQDEVSARLEERPIRGQWQANPLRRISLNASMWAQVNLGTNCTVRTTLVCLVTPLVLLVGGLFLWYYGVFEGSNSHVAGIAALSYSFLLFQNRVLNLYSETRHWKQGYTNVTLPSIGLFCFVFMFLLIPDREVSVRQEHEVNRSSLILGTHGKCTPAGLITKDMPEFESICLNSLPRPFVIHSDAFDLHALSVKKIDVGITKLFQTVNTLWSAHSVQKCGGGKFLQNLMCNVIFNICDNSCRPLYSCPSVCDFLETCNLHTDEHFLQLVSQLKAITREDSHLYPLIFTLMGIEQNAQNKKHVDDFLAKLLKALEGSVDGTNCQDHVRVSTLSNGCIDYQNYTYPFFFKPDEDTARGSPDGKCGTANIQSIIAGTERATDKNMLRVRWHEYARVPVFWIILSIILVTNVVFLVRLFRIARHVPKKMARSISQEGSKFTGAKTRQMKPVHRMEVAISCVLSTLVGWVMFWHGWEQEQLLHEHDKETAGAKWYLCSYYGTAILSLHLSGIQGSAVVRNVQFVKHATQVRRDRASQGNCLFRLHKIYLQMFGFRTASAFFFMKVVLFEVIEVIVQVVAFDELSRTANLTYISISSTLLFLNMTVSPLLLLFRERLYSAKYVIYFYDSFLDLLYIWNGLFRGGDYITEVETDFWVCISILHPAILIGWRTRSIYRASLLFEARKKPRNVEGSFSDRVLKMVPKFFKEARKRIFAERVLFGSLICVGFVGIISMLNKVISQNAICANNLTPILWKGATPKKLFPNGLFGVTGCGYDKITTITADGAGVQHVPAVIGRCKALNTLSLRDNAIASLPIELVDFKHTDTLQVVDLSNNPVAQKLNVEDMGLGVFPTPFVCKFLSRTLEEVYAARNQIRRVSHCIVNFTQLAYLDVSNNDIGATGLHSTITSLKHLKHFDPRNNPVSRDISWRGAIEKSNEKEGEIKHFLSAFFTSTVEVLDLSNNGFRDGMLVHFFLSAFPRLRILNMSRNSIKEIFRRYVVADENKKFNSVDLQCNISQLDLSNNPIDYVSEYFVKTFHDIRDRASVDLRENRLAELSYFTNSFAFPKYPADILDQFTGAAIVHFVDKSGSDVEYPLSSLCPFKNVHQVIWGQFPDQKMPTCFSSLTKFASIVFDCKNKYRKSKRVQWYHGIGDSRNFLSVSFRCGVEFDAFPYFNSSSKLQHLYLSEEVNKRACRELPRTFNKTHNWNNLKKLTIKGGEDGNKMTGVFPQWKDSNLTYLDMGQNDLHGRVEELLFAHKNLGYVSLNGNRRINGSLSSASPTERLKCLNLEGTSVGGAVPWAYIAKLHEIILPKAFFKNESAWSARVCNATENEIIEENGGHWRGCCTIKEEKITCRSDEYTINSCVEASAFA